MPKWARQQSIPTSNRESACSVHSVVSRWAIGPGPGESEAPWSTRHLLIESHRGPYASKKGFFLIKKFIIIRGVMYNRKIGEQGDGNEWNPMGCFGLSSRSWNR